MSRGAARTRELTILIVDDDEIDVMAVRRAFRDAKILNEIQVASDGVAALERLRGTDGAEATPSPYIVLLDINMPRMSGLEFLEELRADPELVGTIVFMLTTSKDPGDIAKAYEKHVAGYIVKESAGEDFECLLAMIDGYWKIVELPAAR